MSYDCVIEVSGLSKCYHIYRDPRDRVKQMVFRNKKRYYDEFWALRDVSFSVERGETIGIVGRNGSGKSTLLQIISGTLSQSAGDINVNGRIAALLELGAGFNPEFTGIENVRLAASLYGLNSHQIAERLDAISRFADIGDHINQPVKTYSSGMYVRLAFSVISHVDADILVVDEALAVGDAYFTQKCMRFLRGFMERGTVLFVSHDTAAVMNLCKRAIWLENGRMRAIGDPREIAEDYLASFYGESGSRVGGESRKTTTLVSSKVEGKSDVSQPKREFPEYSNRLRIFPFEESRSREFGNGAAEIVSVTLDDPELGRPRDYIEGGELVEIQIRIKIKEDLSRPIVGFSLKDRLGQVLFGENTFLSYKSQLISMTAGSTLKASFRFLMPVLPQGDYIVAAAVATGTQLEHRQEHWIHDALVIRSISDSLSTGLIGIPMDMILLETEKDL